MPDVFDRANARVSVSAERATEMLKREGYTSAAKTAPQYVAPQKTARSLGGTRTHERG